MMQLSIYLDKTLIQKVDRLAKQQKQSRSRVVSELLTQSLQNGPGLNRQKRLLELAGSWQDSRSAHEIIRDIYTQRTASRQRAEIK